MGGTWLTTFRDKISVPSSRVKQVKTISCAAWRLKMVLIFCPETSVTNYHPPSYYPKQSEGHNSDCTSCQCNPVIKNVFVVNSLRMCKAFALFQRILCNAVKAVTLHQVTSCSLHVSVPYTHQGWSPVQVIRSVALVFVFLRLKDLKLYLCV